MTDYESLADEELLRLLRAGDARAEEAYELLKEQLRAALDKRGL